MAKDPYTLHAVPAGGGSSRGSQSASAATSMATGSATAGSASAPVIERVARVLELIRPAVQSDGGDIELVEVTSAGIVRIRLHGSCVGCPSSNVTLKAGIERNLRDHVPEVRGVEAVDGG